MRTLDTGTAKQYAAALRAYLDLSELIQGFVKDEVDILHCHYTAKDERERTLLTLADAMEVTRTDVAAAKAQTQKAALSEGA